ncbi:MAG: hypothetical protein NC084_05200 [Bacteroides sp.]|nr:hypothetical protein [Eubacterium sp.]MCM1418820.1 hypothetical protein [Roseburia sp.]MCM1462094.1 hypothetical protein [Bacteroides sp.]
MNSENPPNPPEPCFIEREAAVLTASGMMIAPYGEYSFTELKAHYAAQIEKNADAERFFFKGMTLLSDLRAALIECKKRGREAVALLAVDDELATEASLPADAALITLQSMGLSAFGLSAASEETLTDAYERLAPIAAIPLFLQKSDGSAIPIALRAIERETALLLANEREAFFLESDTTEISEEITADDDMEEAFHAAAESASDVLKIVINTPDDAVAFAEKAPMATLPVMFSGENDTALMLALMLYQGRALIDRTCGIDEETLEKAIGKYGAVLY